jgi:hypothetical protein
MGSPPTYDVVVAMWTHEEGRSDLSLELDLRLDGDPGSEAAQAVGVGRRGLLVDDLARMGHVPRFGVRRGRTEPNEVRPRRRS